MTAPRKPEDLRYTKEHEWVAPGPSGEAVIGITAYAVHELGDVVYVQLPEPGTAVEQFQKFGEVESVKAVSDLFAPVTGEVLEANTTLVDRPESLNDSPYEAGWMLRVRMANPDDVNKLLDYGQY